MTSRLSRNALTLLVSNVGSAALSFVLSVLIGRALGEDGLGVYVTALAWVFPLSLVAEFGLGTLITRDVAQVPASEADYLHTATFARLWLGGGLTLLLVIAAPLLSDDAAVAQGLQISAPLIIILPFFGMFTALFRARQVMWPIPWLNVGMLAAQVIFTVIVFLAGGGVRAALIVNTVTSAGQLAAAWAIWRWKFETPTPDPVPASGEGESSLPRPKVKVAVLLRRAWPFALAAILAALQTRIGTILLERLSDTGEVGQFAAASRFVEAGRMIPNAFFGALFPALATLAVEPQAISQTFTRTMWGLAAFGISLGLIFSIFGGWIMALTYGGGFAPAIPVLQVLMWSLLPGLLRGGRTLYWYALGRERFVNNVTGVVLIVQIGLSLWLIPQYGAFGLAAISVGVELLALALLWWPVWKR